MIQVRKILIPTDFSENAAYAYPYGRELAERLGASVLLVHVMEPGFEPSGTDGFAAHWEQFEAQLAAILERDFAEAAAAFDGLQVRTMRRDGSPLEELLKVAREEDVDLIVMSTHGHTGVKHLLIGSTAEKLLRTAPCPVLTVHPGERCFVLP